MERLERYYKIDRLLKDRKLVPFSELQQALEVSRATLKRNQRRPPLFAEAFKGAKQRLDPCSVMRAAVIIDG